MNLPPIPPWDSLHPLVVHFPIALLMVSPVFLLVAMLWRRGSREFALAALLLLGMGTAGTYVAMETGEAGAELVERTPEIDAVLEQHEEMAERTSTLFTILTVAYAALIFAPVLLKRELPTLWRMAIHGVFILAVLVSLVNLANTAHLGGRLVHELGVHALLGP